MRTLEQQLVAACSLDRRNVVPSSLRFGPTDLRSYLRLNPDVTQLILERAPDDTPDHTRPAYIFHRPGGGYEVGRFNGTAHEIAYRHEPQDAAADFVLAFWGLERLQRPITEEILKTFRFLITDYGFITTWRTEHWYGSYVAFKRDHTEVVVEIEGLSHNCDVRFARYERDLRQRLTSLAELMMRDGVDPYGPQANMQLAEKVHWIAAQMRQFVLTESSGDPFHAVLSTR